METNNVTQVANPGRATARTLFQNIIGALIGFGLFAPIALQWVVDLLEKAGFGELAAKVAAGLAASAAVAAGLARVMALPGVENWLQQSGIFRWLAAAKESVDNGPGDLGFDAHVSGYVAETREHDDRLTEDGTYDGAPLIDADAAILQEDENYVEEDEEPSEDPRHRAGE